MVGALAVAVAVAGCAAAEPPAPAAVAATPPAPVTALDAADAAHLAVAAGELFFRTAPAVVLATSVVPAATEAAVGHGVPLLLAPADPAIDPAGVADEVRRLQARTLLVADEGAARWVGRHLADLAATPPEEAPELAPPPPPADVLVLHSDDPAAAAAVATARAAGARLHVMAAPDPRADPDLVAGLAAGVPDRVVAVAGAAGPAGRLAARLAVAATGVELPGGGQVLFPGRRMVALYGNPTTPALGVLGEQDVAASVARARQLAAEYQPFSAEPVVPAFEIITTVASTAPGADGDYSAESEVELLRPYVDAARDAGIYVVLDLQPGRADFLGQARRYEELLVQPHVGLALDPEWRLGPGQVHLAQIGSVSAAEVNAVAGWLAALTRERALPQKLLLLHQFRTSMITERERLDTSHDELAVMIHADGFGAPGDKLATWEALRAGAPPGVVWGWKNFYDEDAPLLSPEQTLAVSPDIRFVSFQ